MKKYTLSLLFVFMASIFLQAQTQGDLTVTTSTDETGGNYAPKNIVAIWIEDDAGNFVKTLLAYAATRITHLNKWQASTNAAGTQFNTLDAITGATRSNHDIRNCSWNATNFNSELVMDGTYTVWMELTDKNGTGNFSSFPFTKGTNTDLQTPADVPSFSAIEINWEPDTSGVLDIVDLKEIVIYPNPSSSLIHIDGMDIQEIEIRNSLGKYIYQTNAKTIDISGYPAGIYWILIKVKGQTITKKLIKK